MPDAGLGQARFPGAATVMEPAPGRALAGKPSTEELAGELMARAQADGVSLVGPGGLLADLTKRVLEPMFGEGAKLIALAGFGFEEGEHARRTVMSGSFGVGWTVRGRLHRVMSAGSERAEE